MNKKFNMLLCVVAGIIFEFIFHYIFLTYEADYKACGAACAIAGALAFGSLILLGKSQNLKRQNDLEDSRKTANAALYTFIVAITIALSALVLMAKDDRDREESRRIRKVIEQLEVDSDKSDKEYQLAVNAQKILSQAKSNMDEANLLAEYISSIDFNSSVEYMTSPEMDAYMDIRNLNVYFYDVESAQTYYDEGKYEECIKFSKTAIKYFQEAKDAYIGHRGSLDKYR